MLSILPSEQSYYINYDGIGDVKSKLDVCTIMGDTGEIVSMIDSEGKSVAKAHYKVRIGEGGGSIEATDLCISSEMLKAKLPEHSYKLVTELLKPNLVSYAPSKSVAPSQSILPSTSVKPSTTPPTAKPTSFPKKNLLTLIL